MLKFMLSKTMKEEQIRLSDAEQATMIWHGELGLRENHKLLLEICERTTDEVLKGQIRERIAEDQEAIKQFQCNSENEFYIVITYEEIKGQEMDVNSGFFRTYAEAENFAGNFARTYSEKCTIAKAHFGGDVEGEDCRVAELYFSSKGELKDYYSGEIETICDWELKKRFEEQYITLPNPFRRGDIVEIVGTNTYGVVMSYVDDEDWEQYDARCKAISLEDALMADFSDICVTVETLWGTTFGHVHVYPYQLEYATFEEEDLRGRVLEIASRLVRGKGSIEELLYMLEGNGENCANCTIKNGKQKFNQ